MTEQQFLNTIQKKAEETGLNPLLILSGIEGLYTFKDVPLNEINYDLLDSLILTIFALRVGDRFHEIAEENLTSKDSALRAAANKELEELQPQQLATSSNEYLKSFATVLNGKSAIRNYHIKALEVAAVEIKKAHLSYNTSNISIVMLELCKSDFGAEINFSSLFS